MGMAPKKEENPLEWTAMDVLIAYASEKKWVTAKAGRPDVNRAGNASKQLLDLTLKEQKSEEGVFLVLRALAEGRVAWGFWPPSMDSAGHGMRDCSDNQNEPVGIWIPRSNEDFASDEDSEVEEDAETQERSAESNEAEFTEEETDDGVETEAVASAPNLVSRFDALAVEEVEEEDV
jgi:hypothetical protein